jgi:hypothetical protein
MKTTNIIVAAGIAGIGVFLYDKYYNNSRLATTVTNALPESIKKRLKTIGPKKTVKKPVTKPPVKKPVTKLPVKQPYDRLNPRPTGYEPIRVPILRTEDQDGNLIVVGTSVNRNNRSGSGKNGGYTDRTNTTSKVPD